MEYLKVFWEHDLEDEPVVILYEVNLEAERLACRSVDIFADGKSKNIADFYKGAIEIVAIPTVEEFNSGLWGEEFQACLITKEKFEEIWEDGEKTMEIKSYGKENYVSVWVGKCKEFEVFNKYIEKKYGVDDEESAFGLGTDFGIKSYNEDFSLVYFNEEATNRLDVLLDVGAPDYVMEYFIEEYGLELDETYNCAVMFYDMEYTGEIRTHVNPEFGEFVFLGNVFSNKFDML